MHMGVIIVTGPIIVNYNYVTNRVTFHYIKMNGIFAVLWIISLLYKEGLKGELQ